MIFFWNIQEKVQDGMEIVKKVGVPFNRIIFSWNISAQVQDGLEIVKKVGLPSPYMEKFDLYFRPSWTITVLGFVPIIGNFVNVACALHAYKYGETWYGHQKLAQAAMGSCVDITWLPTIKESIVGVVLVTGTRMGSFAMLNQFLNPSYYQYKQ